MPTLLEILTKPDTRRPSPGPLRVDLSRVFRSGIAVWAFALVVSTVLLIAGRRPLEWVAICAVGLLLGFAGLAWGRDR